MFGGSNSNGSANSTVNNTTANSNIASSTPRPAADCPTSPVNVSEVKGSGGLDKYLGCTLSVKGKLWDVRYDMVVMIDTADRTDYNGSFGCPGSFSGSTYSDIGLKVSTMKVNQQFDKLPTATFTGKVIKIDSYTTITNCALTDVQKAY